ncbi:hypothetical protein NDU88_004528 [Pleurodeles waltl]|uniref:Uncharacterized protein n=1 Tax=Pleurodeles waltl TaxID=8319 RepID=A0AAV7L269_PLEWA|nr:hypothetical protein NDU88_004528 [Pleurodeles waltl]
MGQTGVICSQARNPEWNRKEARWNTLFKLPNPWARNYPAACPSMREPGAENTHLPDERDRRGRYTQIKVQLGARATRRRPVHKGYRPTNCNEPTPLGRGPGHRTLGLPGVIFITYLSTAWLSISHFRNCMRGSTVIQRPIRAPAGSTMNWSPQGDDAPQFSSCPSLLVVTALKSEVHYMGCDGLLDLLKSA